MYLFSRIGHFKKIILKGRGFRCGSDEKMMKMWFGLEIDVVGLPLLVMPGLTTNSFLCAKTECRAWQIFRKFKTPCGALKSWNVCQPLVNDKGCIHDWRWRCFPTNPTTVPSLLWIYSIVSGVRPGWQSITPSWEKFGGGVVPPPDFNKVISHLKYLYMPDFFY